MRGALLLLAGIVIAAIQLGGPGASAATAVVSVAGANNAVLTLTIGDPTADLGSNLDPDGTDSDSLDVVFDYQGSSKDQGTYYLWTPNGTGNNIEVKSNRAWNGTVVATENLGAGASDTITIESGAVESQEVV